MPSPIRANLPQEADCTRQSSRQFSVRPRTETAAAESNPVEANEASRRSHEEISKTITVDSNHENFAGQGLHVRYPSR